MLRLFLHFSRIRTRLRTAFWVYSLSAGKWYLQPTVFSRPDEPDHQLCMTHFDRDNSCLVSKTVPPPPSCARYHYYLERRQRDCFIKRMSYQDRAPHEAVRGTRQSLRRPLTHSFRPQSHGPSWRLGGTFTR